jgi:hypothetical protein
MKHVNVHIDRTVQFQVSEPVARKLDEQDEITEQRLIETARLVIEGRAQPYSADLGAGRIVFRDDAVEVIG